MTLGRLAMRWGQAALLLLTATALGAAAAAAAPGPSAADKDTARMLMDEGDAKLQAGDPQGALERYRAADRIMKVPTTGVEVGRVLSKLGKLVEARDVLLRVRRYPVRPDEPKPYATARGEATRMAEELAPRICTLIITLKGTRDVAAVALAIDGTAVAVVGNEIPRRVNPGQHDIAVSAPGYRRATRRVRLAEGAKRRLSLTLVRDPNAKPIPTAASSGALPPPGPPVGGGASDGPEEGGGLSLLVPIGFVAGSVGLLTGVIAGSVALATTASLDDRCVAMLCSTEDQGAINRAVVLSHLSTAGFALAGAGAAVGVVGLLLGGGSSAPEDHAVRLHPLLSPTAVGLEGVF